MLRIVLATLALAACVLGADLTGNWSGEGVLDGETHPLYFVFKQDGGILSGTIGPNASRQVPFKDGRVDGDKVVFEISEPTGVTHFELHVDQDTLKGTIEYRTDGGTQSATVTLKKATG